MRLKSLEIKGFKSFADKTIVNFDEDVTGIIGPNGCGKSNIVDAIRWVIGEQKISSLRSENLEALVFNGSKTRSASGLAEVSLTFENTRNLLPTEFSTVTVTRRFYKNGESEYRLNDVQCRLKDIHNLFLDTGISTDSYAIIELGMVDDIIKDKENSRRRMLEQAAGISIYKTRKKEAKNKLEATEQDLNRIEDLLFEINNQLKMLENQAKKAEKYYEIKKEYKEISIELSKAALEGFNTTFRDLNEQQKHEVNEKLKLEAEIATKEAGLEQEKLDFVEKERALQLLQYEFNLLIHELRSKENEKKLALQELHYLKEKESHLNDFLNKAEGQLKGINDSTEFSHKQMTEEEKIQQDIQSRLETLKAEVETKRNLFDEKRNSLDGMRRLHQQIQRDQFEAEKNVAVADTTISNLQRAQTQLTEEKYNRDEEITKLGKQLREKEDLLENKRIDLQQLQENNKRTKDQILETQAELEMLRNELAEENRKLDAKRNEHELLKSLIDSMEGYPESVKFLHNNTNWNNEAPVLSDLIYVTEEYRTAVENVLEPYLNYYVVHDLQEGLQAIQLLDENKKGKAHFFMQDKINESTTRTHQPVNTIPVLSIIEIDDQYKKLAEYLLANVYIAEKDEAFEDANDDIVILEKNGKYVKTKYTLTGGSVGLFEGKKIGRARNLEKLSDEIVLQGAVVTAVKAEIKQKHNQVIGFNEQLKENIIKQTENQINQLINEVFAEKNKIENLQAGQEKTNRTNIDLKKRLQNEQESIAVTRTQLEQLNSKVESILLQLKLAEKAYQSAEQNYSLASARYNDVNIQFTRQQSKIVAIEQEKHFRQKQLNDLLEQIDNNTAQLTNVCENIGRSEKALMQSEKQLIGFLRKREEEEKKLNEADQLFYKLRNTLQEKESELRLKIKSKEVVEQLLGQIKDKLNELKLQLTGIKERLNVEFKIDINDIIDQPRNTKTLLEDLQASAERMRKRLENIGEINPVAIEAFQEMKKRYEFILEQKNDLVNAKESLLETIQEVEATANQHFLNTFDKVRENFQKVFKALFTEEDTADLVLDSPECVAETGIDIIAKPKGKRPSSITQLSGGEKTLTATALLFAIYLIKPAPFCILDEVDAPLDDANVGKFTQMIKKFSDKSQFIIVTHNKMTMGAVDVIYGVTMQEPGVSRIVPVDFRSLAEQ